GEAAEGEFAEVTLGDYSFSNSTAVPGIIIHVDFKLSAVATSKMASSLESQLKVHQMRVREKVNKIVRSSNLDELNDPNLGTIKRLIKEDINRLLRKTYVVEVIITDMRVMEQ
ncbi:MAG TPA: flagellar basal body-associated FliL family protein, partial [Planctomycetaceae bacterium]